MPNTIISVTDLAAFKWCARAYYLQAALGIREPPTPAMALGLLKHAAFEHASISEKAAIISTSKGQTQAELKADILGRYTDALNAQMQKKKHLLETHSIALDAAESELKPLLEKAAEQRAGEILSYANSNNVYGYVLWETILPKMHPEVSVMSKELRLRGRIDKVAVYPDRCVPHELKTGRAPDTGVWDNHRIQAAAYTMLASRKYNLPSSEAIIDYPAAGRRMITINPYMQKEVTDTTESIIRVLELSEEPARCKREKCLCKRA